MAERPGARPAGMYYFNLLPTWEKVSPGEMVDPAKTADARQWQLKGFTNSDCLAALRQGYDPADKDECEWPVEIRLTNKGQPYANSPAAGTDDFVALLDYIWQSAGRTVDAILDGDFAVRPYKAGREMPCPYCPFDAVCRFSLEFNPYRTIQRCGSTKKALEMIGTWPNDATS